VPLRLFRRHPDAASAAGNLRTWFLLCRIGLALAALADLLTRRQALPASLLALAAAPPLERWNVPNWLLALPSGLWAGWVVRREGLEGIGAAVLGLFSLSIGVLLLGTLVRELRSLG
jgi:membrane-associated phospholipid phosphatase